MPNIPESKPPFSSESGILPQQSSFSWDALADQYRRVLDEGYRVHSCAEYVDAKKAGLPSKVLVNRVDIDFSILKARRLGEVLGALGLHATFFVRLHAPEYNPFSFENYRVLKWLRDQGHEIGYHSEIVDQAAIWGEDAGQCLRRDIEVLNRMLGIRVIGVASHGGRSGLNNLDFWRVHLPEEYGLLYEAYDHEPAFDLFHNSRYVSDSEWTRWKAYEKGRLLDGDRRPPAEHATEGCPLIYLLVHSDTYYDSHCYEQA